MFKILSIDGGGIKGAFPAAFLNFVEQKAGYPIGQYFDLVAGSSTGGIIALAIGLGIPMDRVQAVYEANGATIFPSSRFLGLKHLVKVKHKTPPLKGALETMFGEACLSDSANRLLIPTLNADNGKIYIYKTAHDMRFESDWSCKMVDVALATAAAPSYLAPHFAPGRVTSIDGGIWANNPTGNAVVEAIGCLKVDPSEIQVLSLGCTREAVSFSLGGAGLWGWRKKALEAAFCGQSFGSLGIAYTLTSHPQVKRIDPDVEAGRYSLDDTKRVNELVAHAKSEAREALPDLRKVFLDEIAPKFVPFHGPQTAI